MDYSQFGKIYTKFEEMEHLMKGIDGRLKVLADIMSKSNEDVNSTLLRIEQVIDAFMAHQLRTNGNENSQ